MKLFATFSPKRSCLCFGIASMLAVTAAAAQGTSSITGGSTSSSSAASTTGSTASTGDTGIDDSGNYRSEVQSCKEGRTGEDQATCLLEARNAQAARKRGQLDNGNGQFEANATARCDVFKDSNDKDACEARMMGHGQVSGSVAGGGMLREIEVVIPPASGSGTSESAGQSQSGSSRSPAAGAATGQQ